MATRVPALAVFIPILVALATKPEAASKQRAFLAMAASALLSLIDQVAIEEGGIELTGLVESFGLAMASQFTAYKTLWNPIANINETVAPNVGVGG